MFIPALFILARTWKQPTCLLIDEQIQKLWCVFTMEYYSAIKRNTFEYKVDEPRACYTEKTKYHTLTYIYMQSGNMIQMNLFAGQEQRFRHRQQTYGHSRDRTGWDALREQHWNIITIYKIDTQWKVDIWHKSMQHHKAIIL